MASEIPATRLTPLSASERRELLWLARASIRSGLHNTPLPCLRTPAPTLTQPGAAFVSLHIGGELRGCVGTLWSDEPLQVSVAHHARAAAFDDPRFAPLSEAELAAVEIEISRLTPLVPARPEDVRAGVHGVCINVGERRAVFLPQVAPRYGWNRETLLNELCLKALLPPDAWRWPEARLEVFEAEVFGETTDDRSPT